MIMAIPTNKGQSGGPSDPEAELCAKTEVLSKDTSAVDSIVL
jgi:hypothetical protein